jgi:hypothetical protein
VLKQEQLGRGRRVAQRRAAVPAQRFQPLLRGRQIAPQRTHLRPLIQSCPSLLEGRLGSTPTIMKGFQPPPHLVQSYLFRPEYKQNFNSFKRQLQLDYYLR